MLTGDETPLETATNSSLPAAAPSEPVLPTEQNIELTPNEPELENLIGLTKADLANRLTISPNEITLVEAIAVEWTNSSLGCPQPGMEYLQVTTPGYRILLQANDQPYEYHTNRAAYFVYCEV